ncbi:MAG: segregation/condensation protein A [Bdellovibrionaceae bacterium]|nr:segregation/condensation protein A [Pseudobdellovibrionaceae bacterium]
MSVNVQLSKFEGPLALLLYLIRKDEMDIFDIKINEITTQYLDYIKLMKELDLEVAGEFVAMAATLIQIKSKMLLPQYDEKGDVVETEDPRKELVQKLLEYQKYQEAARLLYERPLVGRDMWTRGVRLNLDEPIEEIEVEENGLFTMISLYRQIMRSAKKRIHQVTAKAQSIASRILEIKDKLAMGTRSTLNELVDVTEDRMRQVLITFLSVLELAKLGFVGLYQTETYGDIWIDLKKPIEKDVVSRVEEYESIDSKADKLFAEAANDSAASSVLVDDVESEGGGEFVLLDAEDQLVDVNVESVSEEEMATDDEILAAELELARSTNDDVVEASVIDGVDPGVDVTPDEMSEFVVVDASSEKLEEEILLADDTSLSTEVVENSQSQDPEEHV